MKSRRERSQDRRRARRERRVDASEREDARALAINPNLWGHTWLLRRVQALVANPATRRPTLWGTGLFALLMLGWTLARVLGGTR